ncbi:tumor necrosis factor receptor superfamily member 14-like isoform X2 [Anomaloglossus baeobatrachus]|uniref:tumor necrosis factor receptor superfamily member 14-like isoform X2 n=1 Tax=Anomaloglossus baeobatrachus TaxID=238106 RepID=UPI003F500587
MGGHLLQLFLEIFMVTIILACPPREYEVNGICCPMCDKGSFVKAHCTRELSSSVCVLCADATYTAHPNGLAECLLCKKCDRGANLIVKQECTSSSNTICGCSEGHFCMTTDCDMCQEHKVCQPGEHIKEPGSPKTDTVCEKCPLGYFSNHTNSAKCSPWKECKSGYILDKEGTSTTDSTCKEKRSHYFIIAAAAFVSTVHVMMMMIVYTVNLYRNRICKQNNWILFCQR